MSIELRVAGPEHLQDLQRYIAEFELDDRCLAPPQFTIALESGRLIGFGRIRQHNGCDEYCSLGVLREFRNRQVAGLITTAIIQRATQPLYLACIIPSYFEPFGFKTVDSYPAEMKNKLEYCTNTLAVPEPYVVMRHSAPGSRN